MLTILVVDDEPLIRWALREAFEDAGYRVLEAGSAREALERLDEAAVPVGAALIDLRLPDGDDLTLLQTVHRRAPDCRIIMMTAHGTSELLAEARGAGAFATISKPFDLPSVLGLIGTAGAAA